MRWIKRDRDMARRGGQSHSDPPLPSRWSSCCCPGGAIYSDSPVYMSICTFTTNTAVQVGSTGSWPTGAAGGALRVSNGNLVLSTITFTGEQPSTRYAKREANAPHFGATTLSVWDVCMCV